MSSELWGESVHLTISPKSAQKQTEYRTVASQVSEEHQAEP